MEDHPNNTVREVRKKIGNFLSLLKNSEKAVIFDLISQRKWLFVIGIVLISISVVGGYVWNEKPVSSHATSLSGKMRFGEKNVNSNQQLAQQLNDVAIKMANIEHHLAEDPLVYIEKVQSDLGRLKQEAEQLATESRQMISNQIQQSTADLSQRLTVISSKLEKLEEEKKQAVYLKLSNLPFQVQHIDNIQQHNIVTVYYDNTTLPVDVGDYLAGWKLISADFSRQKAEFMNNKQQYVVIDLNHLNENKG